MTSRPLLFATALLSVAADWGAVAAAATSVKASAAQMLEIADQLTKSGQADQAEPILELLGNDPSADVRNEARFRKAALLESRGEDRAAAALLRRILDDKPRAAPVRPRLPNVWIFCPPGTYFASFSTRDDQRVRARISAANRPSPVSRRPSAPQNTPCPVGAPSANSPS